MRTLYVTDLDGTLLQSNERLSSFTRNTINQLVADGMLFTYATARSLTSALPVIQGLSTDIPAITYNGAFVVQPRTGERLFNLAFSPAEVKQLQTVLSSFDVSPFIYTLDDRERVYWQACTENEGMLHYLQKRKNDPRMTPLKKGRTLFQGQPFYITMIGDHTSLLPVYHALQAFDSLRVTLQQELNRPEFWLEVMPKQATKANAAKQLAAQWHCDRIICFGDALNDLPLFEIADECYAVSNAVESLKELATDVIGSNDQDGVARFLISHYHKGAHNGD